MRVAFATLGCKINQYETSLMCEDLKEGYELITFDKKADIYIINTCTVTHKADYQSRQLVRRAIKRNHNAKVIVTGCYAERASDELGALGAHAVLGNGAKKNISNLINSLLKGNDPESGSGHNTLDNGTIQSKATFNSERTRAILKIQDGCDYHCSYCIVPIVRGRSRSAPLLNVYEEVNALVEKGYKEVVLSGIQLGSYGKDLEPNSPSPPFNSPLSKGGWRGGKGGQGRIVELLKELLKIKGSFRLRLSSIEPQDVTPELIGLIKSDPRMCRHLHIPLQSGDDEILKAMGRNYIFSYYKELIMTLTSEIPNIGLGTDIIVGFPTESEHNFINTYNKLDELPLSYFHVFSFSSRPGTSAFSLNSKVSVEEIKKRNRTIRFLGESKNICFKNSQVGEKLNLLVEENYDSYRYLTGLTDNYIRIHLKASDDFIGKIIKVQIKGFDKENLLGEVIK